MRIRAAFVIGLMFGLMVLLGADSALAFDPKSQGSARIDKQARQAQHEQLRAEEKALRERFEQEKLALMRRFEEEKKALMERFKEEKERLHARFEAERRALHARL
jgi:gas vesicle protein